MFHLRAPATTARTGRLLFPPNTTASYTFGPCGSGGTCGSGQTCNTTTNLCTGTTPPSKLTTRITEYTVGANGLASMPADLPPSTAYTYAMELSADETAGANASGIAFNNPVVFYVENFLGYPSGYDVPVGWYATYSGQWMPASDGEVITITSFATSGCGGGYSTCAVLDAASSGFGIGAGELNQLALMYSGTSTPFSLQRVATSHFTSFDLNPPLVGVLGPPAPPPPFSSPPPPVPDPCYGEGSIIECENQILAQQLPLTGTPYSLRYQSDRQAGAATLSATIPLTGGTLPSSPSLAQILVAITLQGVSYNYTFNPPFLVNQSLVWTWDRLDAYGNTVEGIQNASVDITYVFPPTPYQVESCGSGSCVVFGNYPPATGGSSTGYKVSDSFEFTFHNVVQIGVQDAQPLGLGGWTLSANHVYDPASQTLWLGNGKRENLQVSPSIIQTVAGAAGTGTACGGYPSGDGGPALSAKFQEAPTLAVAPDGSFYATDYLAVRYVNAQGTISHFAGNIAQSGPCSGTCPAASSWVNPRAVAVGADGNVYIASFAPTIIQKVDTSGNMTTFAGLGSGCSDGPLGTGGLGQVTSMAMAPDGTIVLADENCESIRRVRPDGTLVTLTAPSGCYGDSGDGGPASSACTIVPSTVAVGPDGAIYFSDTHCSVRKIDAHTGYVSLYASTEGGGTYCLAHGPPPASSDGAPATSTPFGTVNGLSVGSDGTLYVADYGASAVWSVAPAGVTYVVSGGTTASPPNTVFNSDNGGPALLGYPLQTGSVAALPRGGLLVSDYQCRVRAIQPSFPAYAAGTAGTVNTFVPSEDGSEIYGFDPNGRHFNTFDGTTGATLLSFTYNNNNKIATATDINGNTTTFSHSGVGSVSITPPFGQPSSQQTTMAFTGGYATTITNPNSETTHFTYSNVRSARTPFSTSCTV